jgi:Zn-dependent protease
MSLTVKLLWVLAAIPSIVLHEVAHGWVANRFGDPTAKNAGRLTLNPLKHIDPFGTIILPIFLVMVGWPAVGYAKPVPVNVNRLRKPRNQSVYVSLAGPATNVVLVVLAWIACRVMVDMNVGLSSDLYIFFAVLGIINIVLAIINMLPIPPLDGSAVVERLVPRKHLRSYFNLRARALPFAMLALLAIFFLGGQNNSIGAHVENSLFSWWLNLIG